MNYYTQSMRNGQPWAQPKPQYVTKARKMETLFFVEITDTFGGEANYSWVTRHVIKAKSFRGCANALSRRSGLNWRSVGCDRYDSKSGATCAFIDYYDIVRHSHFKYETDDRGTK